jgi:glycosyltransferase involved in cell wall biosynthesis
MFTDTFTPQINGVVTSIVSFVQELEAQGHDVYVFAPKLKESIPHPKVFHFKSLKYPMMPEHQFAYALGDHYQAIKDLQLDIIHSHTPFTMGLLALFLAKQHNIPLVHTYHTLFTEYVHYMPFSKSLGVWLSQNASRKYCQSCELVVVPSEAMRKELQDYGITQEIDVIPTGVSSFFTEHGDGPAIRQRHNIPDNIDIITYAGRVAREKNIEFLLRSYREILKVRQHILFVIIGDGPHRPTIEHLAQDLGIKDKVLFTGYISDKEELASWYKASRAFVFASLTETQGLVILEAMSAGTPVVAVNAMGISDVISDNSGGLSSRADISEFSLKLMRLLSNEQMWQQKSAGARAKAEQLTMKNMAAKLAINYQRLIDVATKV